MSKDIKIDPYGFREYDARWLYEKDINIEGIENTTAKRSLTSRKWSCFL